MSRSNLVDIDVHIHHATERAFLVSLDGERVNGAWLPKSAVEIDGCWTIGRIVTITLPEPLAIEKGLV